MTSIKLKAVLLAAAVAFTGSASLAQPAPDAQAPRHERMGERPDPAAMAERRAAKLRDVLQLTPQQEPALRAFVGSMRPPEGGRERVGERRQEMAGLTTPQRLDRMQAMMAQRQARFDERARAIKRFYAQLTPSQQKAFDALRPMGEGRQGLGGRGKRMGRG